MRRLDLDVHEVTIDGMDAAYGAPTGSGPFPGVIVIHEAWGLNDDIRHIAGRFVDAGYATVAPALYSIGFKPLCIARTVRDAFSGRAGGEARIEQVRAWLAARDEVVGDRIGVIGFCMGGAFAITAAARLDLAAASVNYGDLRIDVEELSTACPVVGSYGAGDRRLLPSARNLEATLERFDIPHDVKVYDGAGHSFLNQDGPQFLRRLGIGYEERAAEDAWERILAWFDRFLRDGDTAPEAEA